MFIYQQLTVRQVSIKLGDIGIFVRDVAGTAEMVGVIEENVLGVGGVGRGIAITRLRIVWVFGFLPLNGWTRDISLVVELRSLHPTFGHRVVTQLSNNGVVAITRVVGITVGIVSVMLMPYLRGSGGVVAVSYLYVKS